MVQEVMVFFKPVLEVFLVCLAGYLAKHIKIFFDTKGITEELKQKENIVSVVVKSIQQIYKLEDGSVKLDVAKREASEALAEYGFDVSKEELDRLIESAVISFKKEWKKTDANKTK